MWSILVNVPRELVKNRYSAVAGMRWLKDDSYVQLAHGAGGSSVSFLTPSAGAVRCWGRGVLRSPPPSPAALPALPPVLW